MRFADFELDLKERKLRRGDRPVPLTPKVYDILVYLLVNRDRLCLKEELLASIWPDRVVEEANLTQSISVLRKALDENAHGIKHIGTFPGQGYRFLTPVQPDLELLVTGPVEPPPVTMSRLRLLPQRRQDVGF